MSPALAVPLFLVSLAVTLAAAAVFARRLDRLGVRLGLPEGLLGLLTALAADAPEITSALAALVKGSAGASFGVLVGSNVFNLAAMIGVSALVAGAVSLRREALALEGTVALLAVVITSALVVGALPAVAAFLLLGAVLVPYCVVLVRGRRVAAPHAPRIEDEHPVWRLALLLPPAVALIVGGSTGMVEAALALGDRWHVSSAVIGFLVLAPATSLPNASTAIRLGRAHRGAALVSETLNSNTINLAIGVAIPALFTSIVAATTRVKLELGWLALMTVIALALLTPRRGLSRSGGAALIVLYVVFVVVELTR
jgi:cation:H+ antiporter